MQSVLATKHVGATDQARDELFSHIQRCGVLGTAENEQESWLKDTMEYMADRYPDLTDLELASVELMGRRYLSPPIPHGAHKHATNRADWQNRSSEVDAEAVEAGLELTTA